jgi:hypothetical protein
MVAYSCNPTTQEAEAERSFRLHSGTLFQKTKNKNKNKSRGESNKNIFLEVHV